MNYKRLVENLCNNGKHAFWESKKEDEEIHLYRNHVFILKISKYNHSLLFDPDLDEKLSGYELFMLTDFAQCDDWFDTLDTRPDKNYNKMLYEYLEKHDIQPMQFANIIQVPPMDALDLCMASNEMTKKEYEQIRRQVDAYL